MTSSHVILEEAVLRDTVDHLLQFDSFAFDVETVGPRRGVPKFNPVTWISIASYDTCVVVPMGHPIGTKQIGINRVPSTYSTGKKYIANLPIWEEPPRQLSPDVVFGILEPLFFSESITKVAQEITFDIPTVAKYYGEIPCAPYDDPKVTGWLLDENKRRFGLKDRTQDDYGVVYDHENTGRCVEKHPFGKVAHYSYMDALYAWLIWRKDLPLIAAEGLQAVHAMEKDLMGVLCSMRLAGATVDVPRVEQLRDTLYQRLEVNEAGVYRAAGREFNLNSPQQRQDALYGPKPEGQGLRPWKLTDGAKKKQKAGEKDTIRWYSSDAETLESYPGNKLAHALLDYATTTKLLNGFVEQWLGNPDTGKEPQIYDGQIFTHIKQYGAVTGRTSSSKPNLQNIPRPDTPDGKLIRGSVVAPPRCKLVVADWGQIEVVILAHYLRRGKLWDGFLAGIDPYIVTAAQVLGKRPADVTRDERQKFGKTLLLATIYGIGYKALAVQMGFSETKAKAFQKKHRQMFPEIYSFQDAVLSKCKARKPEPYITTLLGRKRRVRGLFATDTGMRMYAERQVFNSLIQGGAADLMKLALILADDRMCDLPPDNYLSLTVHDEIVAVATDDRAQQVLDILVEAMTGPDIQKLVRVPLKVDAQIVTRWSEAK